MSLLLALIAAIVLGLFLVAGSSTSVVGGPVPALVNGQYQLPPAETVVIHAEMNTGPVAPPYQFGYEISIAANGQATIIEQPLGSSSALATPTVESRTTTKDLGEAGVQTLLADLSAAGLFELPQADEIHNPPIGGRTSAITIVLTDDTWSVRGAGLSAPDADRLVASQQLIADAVGLVIPAELISSRSTTT